MCSHNHGAGGNGPCSATVENFDYGGAKLSYNMNSFINEDKITVLNEHVAESGKKIFKQWGKHMDKTNFVDSDVDEELIFNITFTGHVKLTGLTLIGDLNETHPSRLLIFKDKENMSFSEVSQTKSVQEMQLKQDDRAQIDYPLVVTKFSNITSLTLYFPSNFGAETTRLYYIGFRGEYQHDYRDKVVIATYEARPIPDDHKNKFLDTVYHDVC